MDPSDQYDCNIPAPVFQPKPIATLDPFVAAPIPFILNVPPPMLRPCFATQWGNKNFKRSLGGPVKTKQSRRTGSD
jgi:hypothetical protein